MANQDNAQLIRDIYKAFENKEYDRAISYLAPNAEFKVIGMDKSLRGPKEISEGIMSWGKTFPDMKSEIVNLISAGNYVVVEEMNRGTHTGSLVGPEGSLPPTNRKVQIPACNIFKFENGKIVSWTLYWQTDIMMKQLGYEPHKAAA